MGKSRRRLQRQRLQHQQQLGEEEEDFSSLPDSAYSISSNPHSSASSSSSSSAEISPSTSSSSLASSSTEEMPPPFRHLLLCAIGNPGNLLNTRHSAAHILLPSLVSTPLSQSRPHRGLVSTGGPSSDTYATTVFQSPSYMNVSGGAVSTAWKAFLGSLPATDRQNASLVILHDELEKPVGAVKYKKNGSAGGHNGLSSIQQSVSGSNVVVHKIGLGIGRPTSRDKNLVADYVLQRMPKRDVEIMEERALPAVLEMIRKIGEGELK